MVTGVVRNKYENSVLLSDEGFISLIEKQCHLSHAKLVWYYLYHQSSPDAFQSVRLTTDPFSIVLYTHSLSSPPIHMLLYR